MRGTPGHLQQSGGATAAPVSNYPSGPSPANPVQSIPVYSSPFQSSPVRSNPAQSSPVQPSPTTPVAFAPGRQLGPSLIGMFGMRGGCWWRTWRDTSVDVLLGEMKTQAHVRGLNTGVHLLLDYQADTGGVASKCCPTSHCVLRKELRHERKALAGRHYQPLTGRVAAGDYLCKNP